MAEINKRKRPAAAILGFLIILFTVIGLVTTIVGAVKMVGSWFDSSDDYLEYEREIYPVVMFDPVPFSDIRAADSSMLLQSSMWAVLLNEDTDKYATDDIGFMLIPSIDLDVWCKKMFGDSVSLSHATIDSDMTSFYYDEVDKMYHVPMNAQVIHYRPSVREVVKNGSYLILTVDYLSPMSVASDIFKQDEEPVPDKTMYYILEKTASGNIITAVKFSPDDPNDFVSEEDSSEITSSEEISSEITSSEEVTSGDETVSGDASSEDASSTDTSSEDTTSEDASSEETSSEEESSKETSSRVTSTASTQPA